MDGQDLISEGRGRDLGGRGGFRRGSGGRGFG